MLGAMKGVKMCGLTDNLLVSLQQLRIDELQISKGFRRLLIWNMALGKKIAQALLNKVIYPLIQFAAYMTPVIAPVLTFAVFSVLARQSGSGLTLDTTRVYTSLTLFALLQEPLSSFIMSMSTFIGSVGCFTRIQAFLETDVRVDSRIMPIEYRDDSYPSSQTLSVSQGSDIKGEESTFKATEQYTIEKETAVFSPTINAIAVQNGSFGWNTAVAPLLSEINMTIPRGKLTMLVGPVGCGKSTLLKALLGEVALMDGAIHVSTSEIAYCDQTPWHMNGNVQQSIIAVSELDERWYMSVIRACALDEDLRQLPRGDQTMIGSKGIALSGGQSQRIVSLQARCPRLIPTCCSHACKALARAIYAQKDVIILDDVLSGLDAHTENRVFHNLLGLDGLLRRLNSTVLVASSSGERVC